MRPEEDSENEVSEGARLPLERPLIDPRAAAGAGRGLIAEMPHPTPRSLATLGMTPLSATLTAADEQTGAPGAHPAIRVSYGRGSGVAVAQAGGGKLR